MQCALTICGGFMRRFGFWKRSWEARGHLLLLRTDEMAAARRLSLRGIWRGAYRQWGRPTRGACRHACPEGEWKNRPLDEALTARGHESSGTGNHRGSIFRLIVGRSLITRHGYEVPTWGNGNNAPTDVRSSEG